MNKLRNILLEIINILLIIFSPIITVIELVIFWRIWRKNKNKK